MKHMEDYMSNECGERDQVERLFGELLQECPSPATLLGALAAYLAEGVYRGIENQYEDKAAGKVICLCQAVQELVEKHKDADEYEGFCNGG